MKKRIFSLGRTIWAKNGARTQVIVPQWRDLPARWVPPSLRRHPLDPRPSQSSLCFLPLVNSHLCLPLSQKPLYIQQRTFSSGGVGQVGVGEKVSGDGGNQVGGGKNISGGGIEKVGDGEKVSGGSADQVSCDDRDKVSGGGAVPGGGCAVPGGGGAVPGGGGAVPGGGGAVPGGGCAVPGGGGAVPGGGGAVPGGGGAVPEGGGAVPEGGGAVPEGGGAVPGGGGDHDPVDFGPLILSVIFFVREVLMPILKTMTRFVKIFAEWIKKLHSNLMSGDGIISKEYQKRANDISNSITEAVEQFLQKAKDKVVRTKFVQSILSKCISILKKMQSFFKRAIGVKENKDEDKKAEEEHKKEDSKQGEKSGEEHKKEDSKQGEKTGEEHKKEDSKQGEKTGEEAPEKDGKTAKEDFTKCVVVVEVYDIQKSDNAWKATIKVEKK